MLNFFRRLLGIILAGAIFALALIVLLQFQPEGAAGWAVLFGLIALSAVIALAAYRWFAHGRSPGPQTDDRSGDGYMSGLGFGAGGRRSDDADIGDPF